MRLSFICLLIFSTSIQLSCQQNKGVDEQQIESLLEKLSEEVNDEEDYQETYTQKTRPFVKPNRANFGVHQETTTQVTKQTAKSANVEAKKPIKDSKEQIQTKKAEDQKKDSSASKTWKVMLILCILGWSNKSSYYRVILMKQHTYRHLYL
jgi:hypothetical protein